MAIELGSTRTENASSCVARDFRPCWRDCGNKLAREARGEMADDFDARWTAWQLQGRTHDLLVVRRIVIAIPIMGVVAALIFAFYFR